MSQPHKSGWYQQQAAAALRRGEHVMPGGRTVTSLTTQRLHEEGYWVIRIPGPRGGDTGASYVVARGPMRLSAEALRQAYARTGLLPCSGIWQEGREGGDRYACPMLAVAVDRGPVMPIESAHQIDWFLGLPSGYSEGFADGWDGELLMATEDPDGAFAHGWDDGRIARGEFEAEGVVVRVDDAGSLKLAEKEAANAVLA